MAGTMKLSYDAVDDRTVLDIVHAVRTGVDQIAFARFAKLGGFSQREWAHFLHISERTMQRLKKEKRRFDAPQSERIIQIMMLFNFGTKLFGSIDKFNLWLNTPNVALGNRLPKDLLDSSFGIDMLKDEIVRLEHGVLA